jgi:hypothetical protein
MGFDPLLNRMKNKDCNDYDDSSNYAQKKLQGHEGVKYNSDSDNQ